MKKILFLIFILILMFSCREEKKFEQSPSERSYQSVKSLRDELVEAPYGWKLTYFPRTDSLLFSNPNKSQNKASYQFREKVKEQGFGGFYYLIKFNQNGTLKILSDENEFSVKNPKESEFEIKQNSFTQLSFTTYNHIHKLINEKFRASSDFLFVGKDYQQNLVFKTASYIEPAREYFILEKLKSQEDWDTYMGKAYENLKYFQNMANPQIIIKKGSREFFRSNAYLKRKVLVDDGFLDAVEKQRYYAFEQILNPEEPYEPRLNATYLGSGYVGTELGISFKAGLRYNKDYIFYDFQRNKNGTFSCELVKVYDPFIKKYRFISKHLHPNYKDDEFTGITAEIRNEPVPVEE